MPTLACSPSLVAGSLRPPFPSRRSRGIIPARWAAAWRAPPSSAASRSSRSSRRPGSGPQTPIRPSSWWGAKPVSARRAWSRNAPAAAPPTGCGCSWAAACPSAMALCPMPPLSRPCAACSVRSAWKQSASWSAPPGRSSRACYQPLVSRTAVARRARPHRPGCLSCCSGCWDAWACRPRWSWFWRTCTGPIGLPATCSPSWSGTCGGSGCWWWSPTATTSRATSASAPTWPSWTAPTESGASSWPGWTRPRQWRSWLASWEQRRPPSWPTRCSPGRRATRSSPRSCSARYGPGRASSRPPCGTCSAVGSRPCPNRPAKCLRWWRWPAAGCHTGCWPRSPGETTTYW
jgi:hypothetical protein